MTDKPTLAPVIADNSDKMPKSVAPTRTSNNPSHIIWTLPAIGRRIGVGADFVRDTLAKQPNSPIKEFNGRYYVFEDDLIAFMRRRK